MTTQELASKIIAIHRSAQVQINAATESDWDGIFDRALNDIEALCNEALSSEEMR